MISVLGYPLDRALELLEEAGVKPVVRVIARGSEISEGVLRVVRQEGARLTAVAFSCGAPARKEP